MISTIRHYPLSVHLHKRYHAWGDSPDILPMTTRAAAEILSLPPFAGLTATAQQRVVTVLAAGLFPVPANAVLHGVRTHCLERVTKRQVDLWIRRAST